MSDIVAHDPVFQDGKDWFFVDETGSSFLGPYETEEAARIALEQYCCEILGPCPGCKWCSGSFSVKVD